MSQAVAEAYRCWDAGKNKKAFELFLMAAEQREQLAYNMVGYFYDHGIGIRKDQAKAIYWYRRAARIDDAVAFYNLGLCYLGAKNRARAKFWLGKAAANGDEEARAMLQKVSH